MSNKIRLKRGSGSDPSASDLVVGEVALRTDNASLFTKKDDGTIAEIGAAAGVSDGDKGDITVSNGGSTFTIDNNAITTTKIADVQVTTSKLVLNAVTENRITDGAVTSAKIADGTIVNADINASAAIALSKLATGTLPSGLKINHNNLQTGIIENENISSSAAIAGTKISPNFGSQNIATTGTLSTGDHVTLSGNNPRITFADNNHNPDFQIYGSAGKWNVYDSTNGINRLVVNSDGHVDIAGNLDVGAGLDVTGMITATGEIRSQDDIRIQSNYPRLYLTDTDSNDDFSLINNNGSFLIYNDTQNDFRLKIDGTTGQCAMNLRPTIDSNFDLGTNTLRWANIYVDTLYGAGSNITALNASNISSGTVAAARLDTATTQSAGNNTTKIATTAFVSTAISNLIDSSPGTLNTLNELAAALGDDASFSTTVTNSIATKMPLAGGQFTGNITFSGSQTVDGRDLSVDGSKLDGIESGATADQTASEILTLLKTVDGAGSGLDADTLDGISSASFLRSNATDTCSGQITFTNQIISAQDGNRNTQGGAALVLRHATNSAMRANHFIHDDFPSGSATYYIQATEASVSNDRNICLQGYGGKVGIGMISAPTEKLHVTGNIACTGTVDGRDLQTDGTKLDGIESGATADQTASEILTLIKTVDGSGSGLDADTLDGISSASFVRSDATDTLTGNEYTFSSSSDQKIILSGSTNPYIRFKEGTTNKAYLQWNSGGYIELLNQESNESLRIKTGNNGLVFTENGAEYRVFHAGNMGSGSGLDADNLDSLGSHQFLRSDAADTASGDIGFGGGAGAVTILANSDISFNTGTWTGNGTKIQHHNSFLYIVGGSNGIIFREGATDRSRIDGDGHFRPATDSTYNLGLTDIRWANVYADNLHGTGANITGVNAATLDSIDSSSFLRSDTSDTMSANLTINGRLDVGDGSGADMEIRVFKANNNVSDHIQFYAGSTRVGEIGCEDSTWLRINQETAKNIYTPRYIRADGGFFVDGASKGINGSGNFVNGTIAGASDYDTLLRSNADDSTTGRLGVGTTASNANLVSYVSATGSIPTTGLIQTDNSNHALGLWNGNNSASYCGLMLETRTSGAAGWLIANEWQSTYNGDLVFRARSGGTSSTERLRIKSTGRVEVGGGDIRLQNTVTGITNANSSSVLFRTLQTNGQVATTGGIHAQGQSAWGGDLVLSSKPANSTPNDSLIERVRITAEGSVKFIGNGTPGDNVGSNIIVGRNNTASEGGEIAMCRASDNNPIWKFDCFGSSAQPKLRMHRAGGSVFEFNYNGNFFRSGSTTSDRDLKENIQNLTGTSLDKVIQLTPKTFNFKESEGYVAVQKTGFIAQEVVSVIPSLVNGTDGNKDMGIDYDGVVAHLVNCVKELKELNDSLKARVEILEAS